MSNEQVLAEIRELNLAYLILAQTLIRQDKVSALYRLGISEEVADIVARLTTAQILKIAGGNVVLCRCRFDEELVWNLLTGNGKEKSTSAIHANILMAGKLAEVGA
jgi:flagellar transcriptional activator FlhD